MPPRADGFRSALQLAATLEGESVAREIQLQIEYDPAPPFGSGSPRTASAETVEAVRGAEPGAARDGRAHRAHLGRNA